MVTTANQATTRNRSAKISESDRSCYLEQSILGGLLINNEVWENISILVNKNSFYTKAHSLIFTAIESILNNQGSADIVTVDNYLKKANLSSATGGFAYLAELAQNTPSTANIENYAKLLAENNYISQLRELGHNIVSSSSNIKNQAEITAFIAGIEQQLLKISIGNINQESVVDLKQTEALLLEKLETALNSTDLFVGGVKSGIADLDTLTAGFQASDLIVVAGRPSMGKTAFAITLIKAALDNNNIPIQLYSLEMPAEQIAMRLIASLKLISLKALRNPQLLNDLDLNEVIAGLNLIGEMNDKLIIDETADLSIEQLRIRVRRNARLYGMPKLIVVDYIQLMTTLKKLENRNLEVSYISKNLKAIAKEMNCPVIALAQLNRSVENRNDKRPFLSDLRDSGAIEQDADLVMLLYRDEYYHPDKEENKGKAEIIVAKQRNGETGVVTSVFAGQYSLFKNL